MILSRNRAITCSRAVACMALLTAVLPQGATAQQQDTAAVAPESQPRPFPDITLVDSEGNEVSVPDRAQGRYLVLEFFRSADW